MTVEKKGDALTKLGEWVKNHPWNQKATRPRFVRSDEMVNHPEFGPWEILENLGHNKDESIESWRSTYMISVTRNITLTMKPITTDGRWRVNQEPNEAKEVNHERINQGSKQE